MDGIKWKVYTTKQRLRRIVNFAKADRPVADKLESPKHFLEAPKTA